jgi:hypothetical protein
MCVFSSLSRMMVPVRFNSTSKLHRIWDVERATESRSDWTLRGSRFRKESRTSRAIARLGTAPIEAGMRLSMALVDVKRLSAPSCICTDAV